MAELTHAWTSARSRGGPGPAGSMAAAVRRPRARCPTVRRPDQSGATLLELALCLPALATLVFGAVDLGRVYRTENRLKNAAREGANFAQFFPSKVDSTCAITAAADIKDKATLEDPTLSSLSGFAVTVQRNGVTYSGCSQTFSAGDVVTVKVSATFTLVTPLIAALTGSTITISGTDQVEVQQ